MNIYVSNLPYQVTDEILMDAFAPHGTVTSAKVIQDRATGRSRGFGFVDMPDDVQGNAAILVVNGSEIQGRRITAREARPRDEGSAPFPPPPPSGPAEAPYTETAMSSPEGGSLPGEVVSTGKLYLRDEPRPHVILRGVY